MFCSDKTSKRVRLFSFVNTAFYHIFRVCEEIRGCIYRRAAIMGKELFPETIIKNLSITFYSYYYIMTPRYRLQQARRILESRLLKHITNLSDFEKKMISTAFYRLYLDLWVVMMFTYMYTTTINNNHICYLINGCEKQR